MEYTEWPTYFDAIITNPIYSQWDIFLTLVTIKRANWYIFIIPFIKKFIVVLDLKLDF